jgi:hypothetical protein
MVEQFRSGGDLPIVEELTVGTVSPRSDTAMGPPLERPGGDTARAPESKDETSFATRASTRVRIARGAESRLAHDDNELSG